MVVVPCVGEFGSVLLGEGSEGVLWAVGLYEDVRDCIWKYGLVFIYVVVCGNFCVDVKPFKGVQVGSLFMAVQYLRDSVLGAEGMSFFIKVFRETGCVAIVSEGFLVLFEPRGETSTSLSDVSLITVGTG